MLLVENSVQADSRNIQVSLTWLVAAEKLVEAASQKQSKVSPVQSSLGFQQCLSIIDDGCGMKPELFTKVFNSFEPGTSANQHIHHTINELYGTREHGCSLKLACLRLGKTAVILSRNQDFVSIALVSTKFQQESKASSLAAPIIHYQLVCEDNFLALTPHSSRMMKVISQYCWPLFSSETNLKKYILNHLRSNGTQVFITQLRNPVSPQLNPELLANEAGDIRTNGPDDFEHSVVRSL